MKSKKLQNLSDAGKSILLTLALFLGLELIAYFVPSLSAWVPYYHNQTLDLVMPVPNLNMMDHGKFPVRIMTDEAGFRKMSSPFNPNATIRFLFLGDSYTYGAYIDEKNIWTEKTIELFNQKGIRTTGKNTAVPWMSISQQLSVYKNETRNHNYNVVILEFNPKDDYEDLETIQQLKHNFIHQSFYPTLLKYSASMRTFLGISFRMQSQGATQNQPISEAEWIQLQNEYEQSFKELHRLITKQDQTFLVLSINPFKTYSDQRTEKAAQHMKSLCKKLDIPYLDTSSFSENDFLIPHDWHLSQAGHLRIAQLIAESKILNDIHK